MTPHYSRNDGAAPGWVGRTGRDASAGPAGEGAAP